MPAKPAAPAKPAFGPQLWGILMIAAAGLTASGFLLPWQQASSGGRLWAFSFPEGWVAAVACLVGFEMSIHSFPRSVPLGRRRRVAAISVLCSIAVLACVLFFAVRTLTTPYGGVGSGPGALITSAANLAWTFVSVRRHVELRSIERRQGARRAAEAEPPPQ